MPHLSTAPVLAILVCHDGEEWLSEVLDAVRRLTVRPRHLLAVDNGSSDGSPDLLARAARGGTGDPDGEEALLDGVLTLPGDTGFGAAVAAAVEHATGRWGDPGEWLWLLHDDSAPEPDCLETLLHVADADSGAAMLGPLGLDWQDPRLVVDAGLSMDASGHQQTGIGPSETDPALDTGEPPEESSGPTSPLQVSETLALSTACALIRRSVFQRLDGFDEALPLVGEDIDLGWRINADGHLVLRVPEARMRHAGALRRGTRSVSALPARGARTVPAAQRVHGVRTFLVNSAPVPFVLGAVRLFLLALARAAGFTVLRRIPEAAAEVVTGWGLLTGRLGLWRARADRRRMTPRPQRVHGLLTSRLTRLRNGVRAGFARVMRDRVRRDVVLGRTPAAERLPAPSSRPLARRSGPEALPAGAPGAPSGRRRGVAGLRRLSGSIAVPVAAVATSEEPRVPPEPRPSPVPRGDHDHHGGAESGLLLIPVDRSRVLRELLLAPPVLLVALLVGVAVLVHGPLAEFARFGTDLHGGRLFAVSDLATTWSDYLAAWHPHHGGTGSPAPVSLLVLAVLGTVFAPVGGPAAVVAALLLLDIPLSGISAYTATRALPVPRLGRAVAAAAYALLPAATMSAAQGRLGVVVAHILIPVLLSGIAFVVGLSGRTGGTAKPGHWLGTACLTALGMTVLAAFTPLMHLVLVALALLGFVLVPSPAQPASPDRAPRNTARRMAGLGAIVLLPVACLLPWPMVLLENPQILVHGLGARMVEEPAGVSLAALSPGGSVTSWSAGVLVVAAIAALVMAPCRAVLPGIVVALTGWAVAVVVGTVPVTPIWGGPSTVGWTGAPLVLVASGLVWIVLAAVHGGRRPVRLPVSGPARPAVAAAVVAALLTVASGAVLAGSAGPLRVQRAKAAPAPVAEPAEPGFLLSLSPGPQPARLLEGAQPRFGTDAVVPVDTAVDWLHRIDAELLSGQRSRVREALAAAAARGVDVLAVPDTATAARLHGVAGDLVESSGVLADGRPVLGLLIPANPVELLGPALARQARQGVTPSPESWPVAVEATLPHVAVRVSEGAAGRLLVLGAENEAGWRARVDGREVALATAWGHQVAVPLPARASRVQVTFTEMPRTTLLAVQAAAVLFTLIAALPQRRRSRRAGAAGPPTAPHEPAQRPSMTPGSSPR